jgi:transcriptional regulator with XRE-family HTH domain/orotate phosphoribosyltransferase
MELGEKLRLIRKRRRLSKQALAKSAGISAYYVKKLEEAESKPSLEVVAKLANALGVGLEYFARDILADLDIIRLGGMSLQQTGADVLAPVSRAPRSDWELGAPSLPTLKRKAAHELVSHEGCGIEPTGEGAVCLARIISRLIAKRQVEAVVSLTHCAAVVAGALSAILYEKQDTQIISAIPASLHKGDLILPKGRLKLGLRVLLLAEVLDQPDPLLKAASQISSLGAEAIGAIAIIDMLTSKQRQRLNKCLPWYRCVFSAEDIASCLRKDMRERGC